MQKCGSMNLPSTRSHLNLSNMDLKESYDTKDMDNDGSCFSPRSLFAFTLDRSSIMLDSLPFTDESSDQDLLFDVPPNAPLPQAELLHFHPCKQKTPPDCSLAESEVTGNFPSLSLSSQLSNSSILYPHLVLPWQACPCHYNHKQKYMSVRRGWGHGSPSSTNMNGKNRTM